MAPSPVAPPPPWTWSLEREHAWGVDYIGRRHDVVGWLRARHCGDGRSSTQMCWEGDVCLIQPAHGVGRLDLQDLAERRWVEHYEGPPAPWPDPTPEMLVDPLFEAIWGAIKSWDIGVPAVYAGYMGATGNHARAVFDALWIANPAKAARVMLMDQPTQLSRTLVAVTAISEAIRELESVASSVLYVRVMGQMDLATYEAIIALLKRAGLVKEEGHVLSWVGPAL